MFLFKVRTNLPILVQGRDNWWCGTSDLIVIGEINNFIKSANKSIKLMITNQFFNTFNFQLFK